MHIKVEFALEIVRTELPKVRFVPDDDVRPADTMETGPTREEGVEDGRYVFEVLRDELALRSENTSGYAMTTDGTNEDRGAEKRTTDVGGGGGNLLGRPPPSPP